MLRSWSGALVLAVSLSLPISVGNAASNLSVSAVLDILEAATDSIPSYDVRLAITQCWILTTVQVGERDLPGGGKAPSLDWRVREPGEDPHIVMRKYRQVFAHRDKRRVELFGDSESTPSSVQVFDGELERGLVFATKTGTILNRRSNMMEDFHDYSQYYRTIFTSLPLSRLLRDRTGTRILEHDVTHPGCVVVESPPEQGSFASFGVRVWLDPAFGFLPKWMECYKESMDVLYFALVVNEFREVEPGVWAPIDGLASYYPSNLGTDQPAYTIHAVVDVRRSRWNSEVPDETFTLPFPPGIRVADMTRKLQFVTGEGDAGKSLDRLVRDARQVVRTHDPEGESRYREPRPRSAIYIWVGVISAILLSVVATAVIRRRRKA